LREQCGGDGRHQNDRKITHRGSFLPEYIRVFPSISEPEMYYSPMMRFLILFLSVLAIAMAADLPTRKYLNLAAIKTLAAAAEMEAQSRNVQVTICIVDESGNLLFLQKADKAGLNTIQIAQRKARYAALYGRPSKAAADQLKNGDMAVLAFPDAFPNQGGVPIKVDGLTIGAIACSGAASEVDEAISQSAVDTLLKK
jgi:glc operon protein GlcG